MIDVGKTVESYRMALESEIDTGGLVLLWLCVSLIGKLLMRLWTCAGVMHRITTPALTLGSSVGGYDSGYYEDYCQNNKNQN